MSDRITGLIVSVLALAFFAGASQLEMPFFCGPAWPEGISNVDCQRGFHLWLCHGPAP